MSSILLLTSHSVHVNKRTSKLNNDVEYKFIFEDSTKNPWDAEHTQNWTHLFPKTYPYTSLKEGQTFQLNDGLHDGETFKVTDVRAGQVFNKRYYNVWFIKI